MKRTKKLLPAVLLLLAVALSGCEGRYDIKRWELFPGIGQTAIEQTVNGISFKFCLLNEQGEPATVFKEGENFTLYFRIKNDTGKDYDYDPYTCGHAKDFFTVYHIYGEEIGKSYEALAVPAIYAPSPFNNGDSYTFEVPWLNAEESLVTGGDFQYMSKKMEPLEAGYYYTSFTHQFELFDMNANRKLRTEKLHFKINFRIK